jgi:hypothetical protein
MASFEPPTDDNNNVKALTEAVADIHQRFLGSGSSASATRSKRWSRLDAYFNADSATLARVRGLRASLMANSGNKNAHDASDQDKIENNRLAKLIYAIPFGSPFWLLDKNQPFPADMPPTLKSRNPKHQDASFPVYRIKYDNIRGRLPRDGKQKKRVIKVKIPAVAPPEGWDMAVEGDTKVHSRTTFGGSQFILCVSKPK